MKKLLPFVKSFILFLRPGLFLGFMQKPFFWFANTIRLSKWIAKQENATLNDFYTPFRDYTLRYKLYTHVNEQEKLANEAIDYLEFGVCKGLSFKWWLGANQNNDSRFYGFDTFSGLPEEWGNFKKGSMAAGIPDITDARHEFVKGLFQDTLYLFLDKANLSNGKRKVIHMDADLFSSTLFVLSLLHRHLKPGDIIIFDEFNVPHHEFHAFMCFADSFYVKYKLIGAVNNYFQVALKIL